MMPWQKPPSPFQTPLDKAREFCRDRAVEKIPAFPRSTPSPEFSSAWPRSIPGFPNIHLSMHEIFYTFTIYTTDNT
jgi:hypothetical protein